MPIKPRYMQTTPAQRTVSLDASTLGYLDQLAPDNISEALRYCVQFAMQHPDALFRATVQHTAAQCRKHQQRYPDNAAPLPTTYGGRVMTVKPATVEPEPVQPAPVWTPPPAAPVVTRETTPGTLEDYLLYGDDDDEDEPAQVALQRVEPLPPLVVHTSTPSAAALAAVAAIALTDEDIRALDPARGGQLPFIG